MDFDGNGRIDFDSDPIDAIGSIANYLAQHGWLKNAPVAVPATLSSGHHADALVDVGIEPSLTPEVLNTHGITPATAVASLVELVTPGEASEYWLGYRNFYVITRYNKSSFYAMAVFELGEALRNGRLGR